MAEHVQSHLNPHIFFRSFGGPREILGFLTATILHSNIEVFLKKVIMPPDRKSTICSA